MSTEWELVGPVAERVGAHPATIRKWVKEGLVPAKQMPVVVVPGHRPRPTNHVRERDVRKMTTRAAEEAKDRASRNLHMVEDYYHATVRFRYSHAQAIEWLARGYRRSTQVVRDALAENGVSQGVAA